VVAGSEAASSGVKVTPLAKAIEMLKSVKSKAEKEKHEERVQYGTFEQFCTDVTSEKEQAITAADEQIEKLSADVQKFDTRVSGLAEEVAVHNKEIAGWDADASAATEVRKQEETEFELMHENYTESVTALSEAIHVLKAKAMDTPGEYAAASALVQLHEQLLRSGAAVPREGHQQVKTAVSALLEKRGAEEPDLTFQPPTTAYEFKSGDIIKMLEDLHKKFTDELTELEKAEVDRAHAYNMFKQSCVSSINAAKDQIAEKEKAIAKYKQESEAAAADLSVVTATRADDAKYLTDMTATCKQKAVEYKDRQEVRTEEIQALEKAIELLSSEDVSGAAEKHLPAAAFAQLLA